MFCRNCGKELIGSPELCMNCGARPLNGNSYCQNCGSAVNPLAEICVKCGVRLATAGVQAGTSSKSRLAAVLLAAFLGTFGAHRFYLGKIGTAVTMLVLGIAGYITWMAFIIATASYDTAIWDYNPGYSLSASAIMLLVISLALVFGVSIWAFVDFMRAAAGSLKDKQGKPVSRW